MAILVIVHRTKPIFAPGREFDESNPNMELERNQVINDSVIVSIKEKGPMDVFDSLCPCLLSVANANENKWVMLGTVTNT